MQIIIEAKNELASIFMYCIVYLTIKLRGWL